MGVVGHTTYGLTMAGGLWRATCSCGWRSTPSADLADQTDELAELERAAEISDLRPTGVDRGATTAVVQVVDHTLVVGAVLVGLLVSLTARARRG